ncbi:MAG: c-type cytochrome, partial [Proteobacteria bacterium]|nr:c-type cytochrome [Pseudomonadota bacterium]
MIFLGRTHGPVAAVILRRAALVMVFTAAALAAPPPAFGGQPDVERGKYLFHAAGCLGCHTDIKGKGQPLAGGRKLKTPFGVFMSPNITADPRHGIGNWSDEDFVRALRLGIAPDGRHYFPVFPYPPYTGIPDR